MINADKCCGCGACETICPKAAVALIPNEQGFLSPVVDTSACIGCDLCEAVCPLRTEAPFKTERAVYALKAEKKKRRESQSGGAFALLAEAILGEGGVVYGAAQAADLTVGYLRVTDRAQLPRLKGSKYVQADNRAAYAQVKADLVAGQTVLYSGTPCYVAGLYAYLEKAKCDTARLLTADLVCHGVPSPRLYAEYLQLESERAGKTPTAFVFRDKRWSLNEKYSKLTWSEEEQTLTNGYLRLFSSRLAHRPSCYTCPFARGERVGDLTLGDFWGIERLAPAFDDNRGVSLLVVNSTKGEALVARILPQAATRSFTKEQATQKQPSMQKPAGRPTEYEAFWRTVREEGLARAMCEFCSYDSACHVTVRNSRLDTSDRNFLRAHRRGRIKNALPAPFRVLARRLLKR